MADEPPATGFLAHLTRRVGVWRERGAGEEDDLVAVEEPLEIRVQGEPVSVTMRTPGDDEELAVGFLLTEGVISSAGAVASVGPPPDMAANVVEVALADPGSWDPERLRRSFYTSSSCGVCGKGALEAVAVHSEAVGPGPDVPRELVADLPRRLRERQAAFARTGGLHAAGIFSLDGEVVAVREDVGRHNALDKAIGHAAVRGLLPLSESLVCVSGRLSFELVQKAAVAGAPLLAGVSAPSSLAVELARDRGITLCGFVREGQMNVYAHPERLA